LYVKNFNVFFKFYFIFYCVLVRVTVYVGCLSGVINDDDDDDYNYKVVFCLCKISSVSY